MSDRRTRTSEKKRRSASAPALQEAFVRQTKRLIIRALTPADFQAWVDGFRAFDPSKNEWDAGGAPESDLKPQVFKKLLRDQARSRDQDHYYHFAVFLRKSGRFIGATALMDISRGVFHNAYLGYWIGNIHWGQGYASEAALATIDIAFEDLRLHRVEAGIAPKNRRSLKMAKAIGMRREGLSRKRVFLEGQWRDLVLYALTTEDRGFTFQL